ALARKPAPVQIAWLAYPGTTGVPAMDYRLTDPHLDLRDASPLPYTEQTIWLPETFWCYGADEVDVEPGPLPARANGFITFGSLNAFAKVQREVIVVWARVLAQVDRSRLVMMVPAGRSRSRVIEAFARE